MVAEIVPVAAAAPIPRPGTDLVPDGWCDSVVVPWLEEQTDASGLGVAAAQLDGLIAAYQTLNADAYELVKARRHLELRWGELLPPAESAMLRGAADPSAAAEGLSKDQRLQFRRLAENRAAALAAIEEATDAEQLSRAAVLRRATGAHVGHNSGDNEWYTPADYIKAAHAVMGAVDLDPASTAEANEVVGAERFLTERTNGLAQPWAGRVWMNPPYGRPLIDEFCQKLVDEYSQGNVTEAVVLVNNATETGWFHCLAEVASAFCFPRGRVKFWAPGKPEATPLQGQAVVYLGPNPDVFAAEFVNFGFVVRP